jgi:predicted DCC family thiol-disulfide oxidoreductase YuxK
MNCGLRVATPPPKPLLVFDGDCHFCTVWIRRWQQMTGDAVDYLPAQDRAIAKRFPEIPRAQFDTAVRLIAADGVVYSGAEAVFRTLACHRRWQWPLRIYENSTLVARLAERAYRFVAEHRPLFSALTRWCWGRHVEPPAHFLVRWLFLRALGAVYFIAFVSLWTQINGLIGHDGILPAGQFMSAVKQQCDAQGIGLERYHLLPTLCWFDSSDVFLHFQCAAGTVLASLLVFGIAPAPCLALLWLFYLSLVTVGRDFLGFQWDNLLLEAGFLAIFFAPLHFLPRPSREAPPSRLFLWLLRLLLFKLLFSSGCVKFLSGDPNWRNLTALTFHYQTQPLPTWLGWYAQQLPLRFQKLSCAVMLGIEIGAPLLIFSPRRIRFAGGALLAGLQLLILLTGNYTFFNWLTLALCLLLLDDFPLTKIVPTGLRPVFSFNLQCLTGNPPRRWPRPFLVLVAVVVMAGSSFMLAVTLGVRSPLLAPLGWVAGQLEPFRSVNNYGLFAVMTTQRNEIIVEGSNDGTNWLAYEFKYKPGDVNRRPDFVAPFQPRLDWQMWFAALGSCRQNPWFENFCERLLQGSPDVLALLAKNPFPNQPPRYIRAEFYNYHFTDFAGRRVTGAWWRREFTGEYLPPVSLHE